MHRRGSSRRAHRRLFRRLGNNAARPALLNAEDDGRRRCVVVTNNEVSSDDEKELRARNGGLGSATRNGRPKEVFGAIFARPPVHGRPHRSITGRGRARFAAGYLSGRPYSDGFAENLRVLPTRLPQPRRSRARPRVRGCPSAALADGAGSRGSRATWISRPSQPFAIAERRDAATRSCSMRRRLREFVAARSRTHRHRARLPGHRLARTRSPRCSRQSCCRDAPPTCSTATTCGASASRPVPTQ